MDVKVFVSFFFGLFLEGVRSASKFFLPLDDQLIVRKILPV